MTPIQRVRRAQTLLASAVVGAAALWAAAAGMAALTLVALASAAGIAPAGAAPFVPFLAVAAALGVAAAVVWRERAIWSVERIALWLEERVPQLKYALVTIVDPRYASHYGSAGGGEGHAALLRVTEQADFEHLARRSAGRTLARAAAAAVLMGAVVSLLEGTTLHPLRGANGGARPAKVLGNRLQPLRAEIVPPAYSGLPRKIVTDPTMVAGLYGTQIRLLGDGPPEGIVAIFPRDTVRRDTIPAVAAGGGWAVPIAMPKLPGVLRLEDRQYHRALSLEPQVDSVPQVILRRPARDTTWRWDQPPTGPLVLEADLADDYGLRQAYFEILVSVGSQESFETKDRSTRPVDFGGKRTGTLRATLDYRALSMTGGTVLHIRAVAYDNNTVADSAGRGVSETRTLRVATKQEADTSYVAAVPPPPIDSFFVSQRLLNMRTDTLLRVTGRRMTPAVYQDTVIAYSLKQNQIRQRVEAVIANVEDDGVGGRIETDLSRLLRAASEEMYGAYMFLAIGMADSAYVPPKSHMKEALRLLDEARKARKYYVRGLLAVRPVNLAQARLQGKDSLIQATARTGRAIPEDVRRELRQRLAAVIALAEQLPGPTAEEGSRPAPPDVLEPLLQVKSAALRLGAPAVAAALQVAIDAAAQPKASSPTSSSMSSTTQSAPPPTALTAALAQARRLLDPPVRVTVGPADWGGGMLP